jgi:hypothetical protein
MVEAAVIGIRRQAGLENRFSFLRTAQPQVAACDRSVAATSQLFEHAVVRDYLADYDDTSVTLARMSVAGGSKSQRVEIAPRRIGTFRRLCC